MKRLLSIALSLLLVPIAAQLQSQWTVQTTFPTGGRMIPFAFVVNGKAYMGSGLSASAQYTMDNHEYDPIANAWTQKATPPMSPRNGAVGFTIGSDGYVFGGSDAGNSYLNDLWRYDAVGDSWTQMASLPAPGRIQAGLFVINNKAYVVGGVNGVSPVSDCWEFDPSVGATGTWTQKTSPPSGFPSGYLASFTDGTNGYCGIGGANSNCNNRFWRYDPVGDVWTELTALPAPLRTFAVGGTGLGSGTGFIGLGGCSSASESDFWTFDAIANAWSQMPSTFDLPVPLSNSRSFRIGGDLYVGTGGLSGGYEGRIWKIDVEGDRECIDFEDQTTPTGWYSYFINLLEISQEPGYGNVLHMVDGSGGSIAVNNDDFGGNWIDLAEDGCLCFDYRVDWNENVATDPVIGPKFILYTGPPIDQNGYGARLRANFTGHAGNDPIVDNQWDSYCLPIGLCTNGQLPSNGFGTWRIFDQNGTELTGAAACAAWDQIIQNVTGIVLPNDYNAQPSEHVYFDNFCWNCDAIDPCDQVEFDKPEVTCLVDDRGRLYYQVCAPVTNSSPMPITSLVLDGPSKVNPNTGGNIYGAIYGGSLSGTFDGVPRGPDVYGQFKVPNPGPQTGGAGKYGAGLSGFPLVSSGSGTGTVCVTIYPDSNQNGVPRLGAGDDVTIPLVWSLFDTTTTDPIGKCVKCTDTLRATIPDCKLPEDCCPAEFSSTFRKRKQVSHPWSGLSSILADLSAGPAQMQSVRISLVDLTQNSSSVHGTITSGLLGVTPGNVASGGESVEFGKWSICEDLTAGSQLKLDFGFPSYRNPCPNGRPWPRLCPDTLRFCLKIEYTDCACNRCDTTICYEIRRYPWIRVPDDAGQVPAGPLTPVLGTLDGDNSGRFRIDLPRLDSVDAEWQGLTISTADAGVDILSVDGEKVAYSIATGDKQFVYFRGKEGESIDFEVSYSNLGGVQVLEHHVRLEYTVGGESYEELVPTTFRREGLSGDDILDTMSTPENVRTYALYLRNGNGTREPIDRIELELDPDSDVAFLTVGRTQRDRLAELGVLNGGTRLAAAEDLGPERSTIQPGDSVSPIYVTVAGKWLPDTVWPPMRYRTLDRRGEVISSGVVELGPISSVRRNDTRNSSIHTRSYPNPTTGTATIELHLARSMPDAEIVVTDATGREVARLVDGETLRPGVHIVPFDGAGLPSGTYYYTVRNADGATTEALRIVR